MVGLNFFYETSDHMIETFFSHTFFIFFIFKNGLIMICVCNVTLVDW